MSSKKLILLIPTAIVAVVIVLLLMGLSKKDDSINTVIQPKPFPQFNLDELHTAEILSEKLFIEQTTDNYRLINIWASWCVVCASEHPFLVTLAKQGVNIVGLNYRDNQQAAISVLSKTGNPYQKVIFDPNGKLALDLGVIGTPETYLINQQGMIVGRYNGVLTPAIWADIFEPLIAQRISKEG